MSKKALFWVVYALTIIVLTLPLPKKEESVGSLIDSSVMVETSASYGSGVIFKNDHTSFVWSVAHVIPRPTVKKILEEDGSTKIVFEFEDVLVTQPIVEDGRKVGAVSHFAKVIRYSPIHDLALLYVYKKDFGRAGVRFLDGVPKQGEAIWHVGGMLGPIGVSSVSEGVVAFTGRLRISGEDNDFSGIVYDQGSGPFQKGSSGGGVFLKGSGQCIGLITDYLGMLDQFNLSASSFCFTPARRIREYASRYQVGFAVNRNVPVPSLEEILDHPIYTDDLEIVGENREMPRIEKND